MKNVACFVMLGLVACSPARREAETDIVRAISFDGNGGSLSGNNDYQIRRQMEQQQSATGVLIWPLTYWVTPQTLDYRLLERDAFRLEVWYANHGWFDASFEGWSVERVRRSGSQRVGVVNIHGTVDPGPLSIVREINFSGLNRGQQLLAKTVARTGDLQKGDSFSLEYAYSNRDRLLELLLDHAHAYAQVELKVDAYPKEQVVDLAYKVTPGITSSFGPITVVGNEKIKSEFIQKSLPIREGEAYRFSKLRLAQQRLFEMQTFSLVNVSPDLSDPTLKQVPVEVRVGEARPRRVRAGFGVEYDGMNVTPKLSTSFRHMNLFRELLRFETEAKVGFLYAFSSGWRDLPTVLAKGSFNFPRLLEHRASIDASYSYELDYQAGQFPVEMMDTELNFSWKISESLLWTIGPDWKWFTYRLDSAPEVNDALGTFGQETSRLLQWNTTLSLDWRDDPVRTRRGSYYSFGAKYAIPIGALIAGQEPISEWNYVSISAEARSYRPLRFNKRSDFPLVAAGRVYGEWIGALGESQIPYIERIFVGGSTTVRGFRRDQVGPYDCLCIGEDDEMLRYYFPEGGELLGGLTTELRFDWAYGIGFTAFGDAVMLVDDFSDFGLEALRVGFGLGMRYSSLIGPVRLDFALRPIYEEDRGARSYPGCDKASERLPRATDLLGGKSDFRLDHLEDRLPLGFNIYFTFGEAI